MKKLIAVALSSMMIVTSMAGCSGSSGTASSGSGTATGQQSASKTVNIKFWHAMSSTSGDLIKKIVNDYNSSQTAVHVDAVYQGDYTTEGTKIQAAAASGNAPQVAQLEIGRIGMYAEADNLVDLSSYVKRDNYNMDDYYKGLLDYSYYKGALISLPEARSVPVLYYNADMLKQAGVSAPKTWDDLKSSSAKLTKNGVYGYCCPIDPWYYLGLVVTAGGQIYNKEGNGIGFNNESGTRPLDLWKDMIKAGTMYVPEGQDYNSSSACRNVFISGKVAMIMQSCAQYMSLSDNCKFKVGVSYIPEDKTYSAVPGGANFVLFKGSSTEEQDAAWSFLKYMTSAETAARFAVGSGYLAPTKSSMETDVYKDALKKYPELEVASGQLSYFVSSPFDESYAEVKDTIITNAIQSSIIMGVFFQGCGSADFGQDRPALQKIKPNVRPGCSGFIRPQKHFL